MARKKHTHTPEVPALHSYAGRDLVRCATCGLLYLRETVKEST